MFLACSGSSGGQLFTADDAATDGGSSGGPSGPDAQFLDGSPDNPLATGTCVFTLDGTAYTLPGFSTMNGSGNLNVRCSDKEHELELDVGNSTYEGPGTYVFSSQLQKGSLKFSTPKAVYAVGFGNTSASATCTVVITEAPKSSFAQPGSTTKGTFTCTDVARFPKDEKGKVEKDSNGKFALTDGVFGMRVR